MRNRLLVSLLAGLVFMGAGCISFGASTAAGPMGVFRSVDSGETWAQANAFPTAKGVASLAGVKVYKLFTDPSDTNALYLASRGQGLYFTYNRGESWQKAEALGDRFIYSVAVDPKNKCILFVTDGVEVYRSLDCSRTWKRVYTEQRGEKIAAVAIDYGSSNMVFAVLANGRLLRSTNSGDSWRTIKTFSAGIQTIAADPYMPNRLYAASSNSGLIRTDDGGETWKPLTAGLQNFADSLGFFRLIFHPTEKNTLYWISKYGILFSKDAGETWNAMQLLSPPGSVSIYSFAINPTNVKEMYYVGTIFGEKGASRSTFYKSTDGGVNWVTKKMPTSAVPVTLHINPKDTKMLFMGFTVPDTK